MRTALLLPLLATAALAQFSSMSVDFSGSRLFFSTELSQTGSGQPSWGKAFLATSAGVQPLLVNTRDVLPSGLETGFPNSFLTNFYNIDGVHLASSGSALAVMALRECVGLSSGLCRYADMTTVYDQRGEVALTAPGRLLLSPNGYWALGLAGALTGPATRVSFFNVVTKTEYPLLPNLTSVNREWWLHDIADDGTAVIAGTDQVLILHPPNVATPIVSRGLSRIRSATLDAGARFVVWSETDSADRGSLYLFRLTTTTVPEPEPLTPDSSSDSAPQLSDDGSRILLVSRQSLTGAPQLHTIDTATLQRRQITSEPDGIATAALSGDGRIAWALTRQGRLIRIEIDSRTITQITRPLAAFLRPAVFTNTQVPPSVVATPGQRISLPASVMPGESVEVTMDGLTLPVQAVEAGSVSFQLPWTVSTDAAAITRYATIRKPLTPDWTGNSYQLLLYPYWGTFQRTVAHQDFSGPVTEDKPARPGEIVHLFGTGFGPVTPAVDVGPASTTGLSRLATPHECQLWNANGTIRTAAPITFAGLAPGLTGVYQFDVQLPTALPSPTEGEARIVCMAPGQQMQPSVPLAVEP